VTRETSRPDYKPFEIQGHDFHMAELKGDKISYVAMLNHAEDNRRTEIKLGRYLREFTELTDNEATLLALVVRAGPITAYEIGKVYQNSPVSGFNTSKGKIYPMIARLRTRKLLAGRPVKGDARGTEQLIATKAGERAVRQWVLDLRTTHLLLEDPLRTNVQSFDLLDADERVEWIVNIKALLIQKLDEIEAYGRDVDVPYQQFVHDNAVRSMRSRMDWLDLMLRDLMRTGTGRENSGRNEALEKS
jgi:DNA-binding PadR family transcriptional regulator